MVTKSALSIQGGTVSLQHIQDIFTDPRVENQVKITIAKKIDANGHLPVAMLAQNAPFQKEQAEHNTPLIHVSLLFIHYYPESLTIRDNDGNTPLQIALKNSACTEFINLLRSVTPEAARSVPLNEMTRLYAPIEYWTNEFGCWLNSRSFADCHRFISEHDEKLVVEVLKNDNSQLVRSIACCGQEYNDSFVFLVLRMIHLHPFSLEAR